MGSLEGNIFFGKDKIRTMKVIDLHFNFLINFPLIHFSLLGPSSDHRGGLFRRCLLVLIHQKIMRDPGKQPGAKIKISLAFKATFMLSSLLTYFDLFGEPSVPEQIIFPFQCFPSLLEDDETFADPEAALPKKSDLDPSTDFPPSYTDLELSSVIVRPSDVLYPPPSYDEQMQQQSQTHHLGPVPTPEQEHQLNNLGLTAIPEEEDCEFEASRRSSSASSSTSIDLPPKSAPPIALAAGPHFAFGTPTKRQNLDSRRHSAPGVVDLVQTSSSSSLNTNGQMHEPRNLHETIIRYALLIIFKL